MISDWSGKTVLPFTCQNRSSLRWGVSFTNHDFQPGALSANFLQPGQTEENVDSLASILLNNERLNAEEAEAYFDTEWEPYQHLKLGGGFAWYCFSG
ncbi:MAG: hypothetical protein R2778_01100 [Saprospiraceae bacterium]